MASSLASSIDSQIALAKAYASDAINTAQNANDTVNELISNIDVNYRLGFAGVNQPTAPTLNNPEGKPGAWSNELAAINDLVLNNVTAPEVPSLLNVPDIAVQNFLDAGTAPTLSFPTRPADFDGTVPTSPGFTAPVIPTAPEYVLPTAPTLSTVTLPDVPVFSALPTFSGTLPDALAAPELPTLNFVEEEYTSSLKTAAEAWLLDVVNNGGTGLASSVEQAIFDRALTREVEAARRNLEVALDEFAPGFSRPSGALRARTDQLRAELQNRVDDLDRKILEEQARLAQTNTHFAITEGLRHEAVLLQHHNAIADRALNFAKAVVDSAVSIYNLKVVEYQARLDSYKTEAQVFSELIRAAALEIERYKAELEAAKTAVDVDNALVSRYQAQIQAVRLLSDFYNTQLQGAKIEAEIETLALDAYRAELDGYVAQIRVKELEYSAYAAGIKGETAKIDAFRAQVDAARNANEGKRAAIEGDKAVAEGTLQVNREKLDVYRAEVDVYATQIKEHVEVIRGAVASYAAQADAYRANIDLEKARANVEVANAGLSLEAHKFNQAEANNTFRKQGDLLIQQINAALAAASASETSSNTLAAAALSQINTISQITDSTSTTL
jgi:hypothetical protein